MASYKFAAILAFLVAVSVIQSAQAQAQAITQAQAQGGNPADIPGLTLDQYNNFSSSVRTILFQLYQSLVALASAQQNNQAGVNNNQA